MTAARPRILLVNPNVDTCYEYVSCLGLMSLYLIGRQLGCDMELMDLSLYPERRAAGLLCEKEYDIVGISCNFTNAAPFCMGYAGLIKAKYPRTMVITGGNHATFAPDDLLSNGYDYVLAGEGEATFQAFIEAWMSGKDLCGLDGVVYQREGSLVRNPSRGLIQDLDTLPLNDYSMFDLQPYFKRGGARYIIMETSRGCIYNCSMCSTVKMWGSVFRHKSPERIAEEFAIAKRTGIDFVFMADDDTALDEKNVQDFCRLLIRDRAVVPWGTTIGSRSISDDETFRLMAAAGCVKANICIESANERILRIYRKPFTIEDNSRTCAALLKNGIIVHNHGIIGNDEETLRECLRTYWYLIRTSPIWHVSILEPRPGTHYWKQWDKKGDPRSYRLFGKANVILARKKALLYILYRLFCLGYFLNPRRIYRAFFHPRKWMRFNYANQYRVALKTISENFLFFLKKARMNAKICIVMVYAIVQSMTAGAAVPDAAAAAGGGQLDRLYAQAEQYASQGDCCGSIAALEEKSARNPLDAETLYELAALYEHEGLEKNAAECLERIIAQYPGFVPAYKSAAEVYASLGDPAACLDYLQRASRIEPGNTRLLYTYSRVSFSRQYFYQKARERLQLCLAIDNTYARAHAFLARIDISEFRHDSAIAHMQDAIGICPDDGSLYYILGTIYHDKSMGVRAIECFNKALALGYENAEIYYRLGLSYYDFVNDYDKACSYFQKATESDAGSAMAHFMLALSYAQLKRTSAAMAERQILDSLGRQDLSRCFDKFLGMRPLPRTMGFYFNS